MIPQTPYFFDTSWFPEAHNAMTVAGRRRRGANIEVVVSTYGCPGIACQRSRSFWNRDGCVGV